MIISIELFDKIIDTLDISHDEFLLWDWHRTLKNGTIMKPKIS